MWWAELDSKPFRLLKPFILKGLTTMPQTNFSFILCMFSVLLLLDEPFGLEFLPEYLTNVKIFTVYLIIVFRLVSFPFCTELTQLRRKPYTGNR